MQMIEQQVIQCKGQSLFVKVKFNAPDSFSHSFQESACFFYIQDGIYETIDPFGSITLTNNKALIKKCGNHISKFIKTSEKNTCEAIAIYFHPDIIRSIYQDEILNFIHTNNSLNGSISYFNIDLIGNFIQNLNIYFDNPKLMDEDLAIIKLKELIVLLMKTNERTSVLEFFSEIFFPGKLDFHSTIENNVYSNITVEQLAFLTGKSLSTFKRIFQAHYNQTPARYIKLRKLEKASKLIKSTDQRISEIAYSTGFEDLTTFSSAFNQHFGVSPTQYRMNQNSNFLN